MAFVTLQNSKKTFSATEEVKDFLRFHGIAYDAWKIPEALSPLAKKDLLAPEEKSQVLSAFSPQLEELKTTEGYIENDMICLCPQTPQINELLSKFDKDHYHINDEVRFIFSGRGIFGFEGKKQEKFTIEVTAGDYIVIPARSWHWFTLGENRDIKAIRLFQDKSGWIPYYRESPEASGIKR